MYTKEDIIRRAREVHGDKYDYSRVEFVKTTVPVEIICPLHGSFLQAPSQHINKGQGCPKCGILKRAASRTYDTEEFIARAREVHGDRFDYSKVKYVDSQTKVTIVCPKHGDFRQRPDMHLNGEGCKKCATEYTARKMMMTTAEFIEKARKNHAGWYDYSKVDCESRKNGKVCIICPKHGEFWQKTSDHISGHGCPECAAENKSERQTKNTEDFIARARGIHGDKYNYEKTVYTGCFNPLTITCPKHGDFEQVASYHLSGNGCPRCGYNISKGETEIAELIKSQTEFGVIVRDRKVLDGDELDIYIPEKQIAIEFDGLRWHSEKFGKTPSYHLEKTEKCLKKGIRLIHIFEDEWLYKKEICVSRILNILGQTERRLYARNCELRDVDYGTSKRFLEKNHIQGNVLSKYRYGLYLGEELVCLMTFGNLRKCLGQKSESGSFEMLRFCNKLGCTVVGGAGKLLSHFVKSQKPESIVSYADYRWSDGGMYRRLGFFFDHVSKPNYYYIIGDKRKNRFDFRKSELVRKYGCPREMSEHDFCLSRDWYRIYDCGSLVFKLFLKKSV